MAIEMAQYIPNKSTILFTIYISTHFCAASASEYKKNFYLISPGMTPQEMAMHSIKPSHAYCKTGGDKETVWRSDGEYRFEYDQRGILTNTTWLLRHKLGYTSDKKFHYMARNSICLRGKKFTFSRNTETILQGMKVLYKRKDMVAVYESEYPIYYSLFPDLESGRGYFLYCEKRGKMDSKMIADICAISEVVCPYRKSRGGMMGGGSRF